MLPKVLTVTLNPSIDVTLWLDQLDTDMVNRVKRETRQPGGKGINVSRVLTRSSIPTLATGIAGFDNLHAMTYVLGREGVKHRFVRTLGDIRENITLRVGKETIKVNREGLECSQDDLGKLMRILREEIHPGDFCVFGGSLPQGVGFEDVKALAQEAQSVEGIVAIDTDCLTLDQLSEIKPWLIKPNAGEFCRLVQAEPETPEEMLSYGKQVLDCGISVVLLSLGSEGMLGITKDQAILAKVPAVEAQSTVGAGDSSLAGFLAAHIRGLSFDECVRLAAAYGTASVTDQSAELAYPNRAAEYYGRITITQLQ
ncbi:Tagatose-6-phosphate kinase [Eubacteriaceae bacterium CHKCI005]|nr:Tagatose-6-phosphate kinase [Eubacteriaceae bacterium CHKCI005]